MSRVSIVLDHGSSRSCFLDKEVCLSSPRRRYDLEQSTRLRN
jgi:hypothetical protein